MAEQLLYASKMAAAVSSDPQFTFPPRPRLVPGLVTIPTEDGLIVEGGPSRQFFQGPASGSLLPRLMRLLDGHRGPDDLAGELDLSPRQIWPALSLLYSTGLIEDTDDDGTDGAPEASLQFLARSIDTTRVNASGASAYRRLTEATVDIVTDESHRALAAPVAEALTDNHVGTVRHHDTVTDTSGRADLLIALGDGPVVEEAALRARSDEVTVLPAAVCSGRLLTGPVLDPAHGACPSCLLTGRRSLSSDAADDAATSMVVPLLLTREVTALLSRIGTSLTSQALVCLDLADWSQRSHAVPPRPQCPICMDPSDPDADPGVPLGWAYAHAVSFPPRHTVNPRDHQVHYAAGNIALQRHHRRWPAAPTTLLPDTDGPETGMNLSTVGHLLTRTAGLRHGPADGPDHVDRWCATGGNLGSTTAYLVARDIAGLPSGVYGYQREDDTLAELAWADPSASIAGVPDDAPAALIVTGALDTVASKYGPFGWRIIHLDAGAALAQAAFIAHGCGLQLTPAPVWDDAELADLLGCDPDREPVTAVLALDADTAASAQDLEEGTLS